MVTSPESRGSSGEAASGETTAGERELSTKDILKTPGFGAFMGKAKKGVPFNPAEDPEETKRLYDAFEASKKSAPLVQNVLKRQLEKEKSGRVNAREVVAIKESVLALAAEDPDASVKLEQDLRTLEDFPEERERNEAEYERLRTSVEEKRVELENLRTQLAEVTADTAEPHPGEPTAVDKFAALFGRTKSIDKKIAAAQYELDTDQKESLPGQIQELEDTLGESVKTLRDLKTLVDTADERLVAQQQEILDKVSVMGTLRDKRAEDIWEHFNDTVKSNDLRTLLKLGAEFLHFKTLSETGEHNYFEREEKKNDGSVDVHRFDHAEFENQLRMKLEGDGTDKEKGLIAAGILSELNGLRPGQSEFERAINKYVTMVGEGKSADEKRRSTEHILDVLRDAHDKAVAGGDETGKAPLLLYEITQLEKSLYEVTT